MVELVYLMSRPECIVRHAHVVVHAAFDRGSCLSCLLLPKIKYTPGTATETQTEFSISLEPYRKADTAGRTADRSGTGLRVDGRLPAASAGLIQPTLF